MSTREEYSALNAAPQSYFPSPPLSRASNESDESLRALELSEGPEQPELLRRGRVSRSYSISGFNFESELLPLSSSLDEPDTHHEVTEKNISLISAIALCVGSQIGSGIFSSPGVVVANTQSVGASLIVWLASGVLGWTGASSFAELGSTIPINGGAQAYLAYSYGPLVSYLFAWTSISALRPGGNAVVSLIFSEYLNRLFWHTTRAEVSPDDIPQWAIKLTAIAAVLVISIICVATRNLGMRAAVAFTTVKVAALMAVTILGIIQLARGRASSSLREPLFADSSHSPSSYALALYSGLWAFDGWDQANYVCGEMKNAERNLPRAIHSSMGIVTLLFLLANLAYFVVLDKVTVGLSNTVAMDFGRALFGPVGGSVFAFMVAFSCFGALNGTAYTSSRLIAVAGREHYLPAWFGKLHSTRKTPVNAMCLHALLTTLFISVGGGFRSLINFAVVASWAFYFLTVLGLVILRIKEPMLDRPYKTWIITPLLFCAVALFLLCMPIIAAPLEALAVLGFVSAGIPLYYITHRNDPNVPIPRVFAIFASGWARLRGRPAAEAGWEAVATEGDELEMSEGRGRGAQSR
ncbi:amino acid transporter [Heliocybe sulcata]|uniref:Amino acid transporter n=1 Tax=Heliocybe sulcata TaxID=5364 RepID=A0A5C3NG82_9AGAM|nr:amino acid transporter [Heliocybe sulcata]